MCGKRDATAYAEPMALAASVLPVSKPTTTGVETHTAVSNSASRELSIGAKAGIAAMASVIALLLVLFAYTTFRCWGKRTFSYPRSTVTDALAELENSQTKKIARRAELEGSPTDQMGLLPAACAKDEGFVAEGQTPNWTGDWKDCCESPLTPPRNVQTATASPPGLGIGPRGQLFEGPAATPDRSGPPSSPARTQSCAKHPTVPCPASRHPPPPTESPLMSRGPASPTTADAALADAATGADELSDLKRETDAVRAERDRLEQLRALDAREEELKRRIEARERGRWG